MSASLELSIDKFLFRVATDRLYDEQGVWVLLEEGRARIGLSDFLEQRSGDIAFVEVKPAGSVLASGDEIAPAAVDDGRPLLGDEATQELAALAKAVAHPARVQILRILAERQECVCGELVDEFTLAQSTISEHLRILKDAGLIRGEIRSPHVCYCLERNRLTRLKALIISL